MSETTTPAHAQVSDKNVMLHDYSIYDDIRTHDHPGAAILKLIQEGANDPNITYAGILYSEQREGMKGSFWFTTNKRGIITGEVRTEGELLFKFKDGSLLRFEDSKTPSTCWTLMRGDNGAMAWVLDWEFKKCYRMLGQLPDFAEHIKSLRCALPMSDTGRRTLLRHLMQDMVNTIQSFKPGYARRPYSDFTAQRLLNHPCWAARVNWKEDQIQELMDLTYQRLTAYARSRSYSMRAQETDPTRLYETIVNEISDIYKKAVDEETTELGLKYHGFNWVYAPPDPSKAVFSATEITEDHYYMYSEWCDNVLATIVIEDDPSGAPERYFVIEDAYGYPLYEATTETIEASIDFTLLGDEMLMLEHRGADIETAKVPTYSIIKIDRPIFAGPDTEVSNA